MFHSKIILMPTKYKIKVVRPSTDPLIMGYFFSADEIHTSYGGTHDGRFYSRAAAVLCMNNCYMHYLSRFEAKLSEVLPIFDGTFLIIGYGIFQIVKA